MYILKEYKVIKSRIFTREQALADEISSYFNGCVSFALVMKMIKQKGESFVYLCFNEVKHSKDAKKPAALFIWKVFKKP